MELEDAVATTEAQIYELERRLYQERAEVTDILARLENLDSAIEQVELQIPPSQDAADEDATPVKLTQVLMHAQRMFHQLHGGDLPAEINGRIVACLTYLDNIGANLDKERREREAQVASDARYAQTLAESDARAQTYEDEDVDATGEGDFIEQRTRGRAKKGKGYGKAWRRETTQSPTGGPCGSGPDIGPLATLWRTPPPPPPPLLSVVGSLVRRQNRGGPLTAGDRPGGRRESALQPSQELGKRA